MVKTRLMPSFVKENTLLVPVPLPQVNLWPTVPVLETVRVAPLRPVIVKLGVRVMVSQPQLNRS